MTRIVRDVEEIRKLKQGPGKDIYAIGGPTLVSSLITLGLIDELRLMVVSIAGDGCDSCDDLFDLPTENQDPETHATGAGSVLPAAHRIAGGGTQTHRRRIARQSGATSDRN